MAKMIYVANVSLDGYVEDVYGRFDWTEPTDEVFIFIAELVRPFGTYLYGRSMYETMAVWEIDPALAAQSEIMSDFAHSWQAADKIVYSTTLRAVSTKRTAARAPLRTRCGPGDEGVSGERCDHRGFDPRSARVQRWADRRVPALCVSDARR